MAEIVMEWRSRSLSYGKLLSDSFLAYWPILAMSCFALSVNAMVFAIYPQQAFVPFASILKSFMLISLPFGLTLCVLARTFELYVHVKPKYPITALWHNLRAAFTNPSYLINGIPLLLALLLFSKASLEFKPEIPLITGFRWDETFAQLDRTLHFGIDPFRLVNFIMGYPLITYLAGLTYSLWIMIISGIWVWVVFRRKPELIHTRFAVAFILTWWTGGTLLALIFSSVGPAFYSKLGLSSPDPFVDLMAGLRQLNTQLPVWALVTQDNLWAGHLGKVQPLGISAFPSMHNASAALFFLMFRQVSKGWGRFFLGYAILIFLTSIHLGWHYAIDGYAGMIVAALCWNLAAPIARYIHNQPAMKRLQEGLAALQP